MTGWKIGETVPWSVSWTGEQAFSAQASRDFPGSLELMQAEHPGEGIPRFAALHVTRQRCGIIGQLCHVCGRRTTARDRYVFPVESEGFVAYGGDMRYAGTVPPVHLRCARKSARNVPAPEACSGRSDCVSRGGQPGGAEPGRSRRNGRHRQQIVGRREDRLGVPADLWPSVQPDSRTASQGPRWSQCGDVARFHGLDQA